MTINEHLYDVFISHASEDKEDFVRSLVTELTERDVKVWYDEHTLKLGDRLRESIDKGLAQSRYGIVVLSPSFISKNWPTSELEGLWAVEKDGRKVILPLWHKISQSEISKYSPMIANRFAAKTEDGVEHVASMIIDVIRGPDNSSQSSQARQRKCVPVILAGCGWWARHRTVLPLYSQNKNTGLFEILGVTALKDDEDEFRDVVIPELERHNIQIPKYFDDLIEAIRTCGDNLENDRQLAVIINTPNRRHAELARSALISKCHVYAERPIGRHSDNLKRLIEMAFKENRLLYNGVQRRLEDSFRYLFNVVKNKNQFGRLSSIRCYLASGRQVEGWRREKRLAGGGIVLDEGYHLLDAAVWLLEAVQPGTSVSANDVKISVLFDYDRKQPDLDVEVTAVGTAILPHDIKLFFDMSYMAPLQSVYELIEIRDDDGNRVRLVRDQTERSSQPGRVLHQLRSGKVIGEGFIQHEAGDNFSFTSDNPVAGANNTGPLLQFLRQVSNFDESQRNSNEFQRNSRVTFNSNECDARFVLNTQELIAAIYKEDRRKTGSICL